MNARRRYRALGISDTDRIPESVAFFIGYAYRHIHIETWVPSREIYGILPFNTLMSLYPEYTPQNRIPFFEALYERIGLQMKVDRKTVTFIS